MLHKWRAPLVARADESVTEAAADEVSEEGADTFAELFNEDTEGDVAEVCMRACFETGGWAGLHSRHFCLGTGPVPHQLRLRLWPDTRKAHRCSS